MKTEGQIRQQLKQVSFRHLQKHLRHKLNPRPHNCIHNTEVRLDENTSIFVCGYQDPENPNTKVPEIFMPCDSRVPGCDAAAKICRFFQPLETKPDIKKAFSDLISSKDLGEVAYTYPDIAALRWVLGGEVEELDDAGELENVVLEGDSTEDCLEQRVLYPVPALDDFTLKQGFIQRFLDRLVWWRLR